MSSQARQNAIENARRAIGEPSAAKWLPEAVGPE